MAKSTAFFTLGTLFAVLTALITFGFSRPQPAIAYFVFLVGGRAINYLLWRDRYLYREAHYPQPRDVPPALRFFGAELFDDSKLQIEQQDYDSIQNGTNRVIGQAFSVLWSLLFVYVLYRLPAGWNWSVALLVLSINLIIQSFFISHYILVFVVLTAAVVLFPERWAEAGPLWLVIWAVLCFASLAAYEEGLEKPEGFKRKFKKLLVAATTLVLMAKVIHWMLKPSSSSAAWVVTQQQLQQFDQLQNRLATHLSSTNKPKDFAKEMEKLQGLKNSGGIGPEDFAKKMEKLQGLKTSGDIGPEDFAKELEKLQGLKTSGGIGPEDFAKELEKLQGLKNSGDIGPEDFAKKLEKLQGLKNSGDIGPEDFAKELEKLQQKTISSAAPASKPIDLQKKPDGTSVVAKTQLSDQLKPLDSAGGKGRRSLSDESIASSKPSASQTAEPSAAGLLTAEPSAAGSLTAEPSAAEQHRLERINKNLSRWGRIGGALLRVSLLGLALLLVLKLWSRPKEVSSQDQAKLLAKHFNRQQRLRIGKMLARLKKFKGSAHHEIQLRYSIFLEIMSSIDFGRDAAETPTDFARRMDRHGRYLANESIRLTNLFNRSFYGGLSIKGAELEAVRRDFRKWERLLR